MNLKEHNIPFIRRDDGSGSYMNLYMGQSIQEKRIFVSKEDYERASEIITPFLSDNENEEIIEEENAEEIIEEGEEGKNKYNLIKLIFGLFMIGMPIVVILIVIMAMF